MCRDCVYCTVFQLLQGDTDTEQRLFAGWTRVRPQQRDAGPGPLPQPQQWQQSNHYSLRRAAATSQLNSLTRSAASRHRLDECLGLSSPVLGRSAVGKSKVIAGSHFGIFTEPAGHCGGQTDKQTHSEGDAKLGASRSLGSSLQGLSINCHQLHI